MTHVDLGNDLSITDVPEGIILQWVSTDTAVVDAFVIDMTADMVSSLEAALNSESVRWTNEDRNLLVSGDASSLILTFQMQAAPFERMALRLDGVDASRFRAEVSKRAKSFREAAFLR